MGRNLRRMLYMPAVAAIRSNPILRDFASRLRSSGKHGKQIVAAVMRRLLVLAYGVLKSERPPDPEYRVWATSRTSQAAISPTLNP
jgi:transposase